MSYKIKELLEKLKKQLPIYIVIWVFLVLIIVCPITIAYQNSLVDGSLDLTMFFSKCTESASDIGNSIKNSFSKDYIANTISLTLKFTIVYVIIVVFGFIKNAKNTEYKDIEHGSSDWSKGGEQYKILSNKKGIILAENNYLPLDKRGNVNVLIVGRIWCW